MKKNCLIVIATILLIPFSSIGQISTMSFNIRYDNPDDKENWWNYRKDGIAKMIDYYSPTFLGIQEGLEHQVKYLDSVLADYNYVGVGRDDGKTKGEYTAIFYKKSDIQSIRTKTYWLSETPEKVSVGWDASMERITTFTEFHDKKGKETLYVFNCHFDHKGSESRKKSAELILKLIEQKKISNEKVIVMGDFNCTPTDRPIKILKTVLNDSFETSLKTPYGPIGTFNGFKPNARMDGRIDYIFTKNINVLSYSTIDDRRTNQLYLSDHLPVFVQFE